MLFAFKLILRVRIMIFIDYKSMYGLLAQNLCERLSALQPIRSSHGR